MMFRNENLAESDYHQKLTTRECLVRFEYFTKSLGLEKLAPVSGGFCEEPPVEIRFDEVWVDYGVIVD
jgi:hypothetical protein